MKLPEKSYPGYDHVHWTILNAESIDKGMGTTHGEPRNDQKDGTICLVGRASDGRHYTLFGPISPSRYWRIKALMERPKVTRFRCTVCDKLTAGRMPRDAGGRPGDTTVRFPRRHKVNGKSCPGNIEEADWV